MSSYINNLLEDYGTLNPVDVPLTLWEKRMHALLVVLSTAKPTPLLTTDELRRGVESLEEDSYRSWSYYDRWAAAITTILLERGVITEDALHQQLYGNVVDMEPVYSVGDHCRIKNEDPTIRWRKPHLRTPGYIYGLHGVITHVVGVFDDPSLKAFRSHGPKQPLYRIAIAMKDVLASQYFNNNNNNGNDRLDNHRNDILEIEIYQPWLELYQEEKEEKEQESFIHHHLEHNHDDNHTHDQHHHHHDHNDDHDHNHEHAHAHHDRSDLHDDGQDGSDPPHDHGHEHEGRLELEERAVALEGSSDVSPGHRIGEALMILLEQQGILTKEHLSATIDRLDGFGQRLAGADLVVRAWIDPSFKQRLLHNAAIAAEEIGISVSNPNAPTVLIVVENTPSEHHLIVCTLCSCYPSSVLGLSPAWYKSKNYRARAVLEPRALLAEFGTVLPLNTRLIVHDSTADCRYMVLPMRPNGTEGWNEEQLRTLVTRDSMVGVSQLHC